MKRDIALAKLAALDKRGIFVFTLNDFAKMFPDESGKTLLKSTDRLVAAKILERTTKRVYFFSFSRNINRYLIEVIANVLRSPISFLLPIQRTSTKP